MDANHQIARLCFSYDMRSEKLGSKYTVIFGGSDRFLSGLSTLVVVTIIQRLAIEVTVLGRLLAKVNGRPKAVPRNSSPLLVAYYLWSRMGWLVAGRFEEN